jgi:Icc-related predicted phosphoesterase
MTNKSTKKTTFAAMADIHIGETSRGEFNELFEEISTKADALLLCGDLTQRGTMSEIEILANELLACKVPVVAVLGNHDFENNQQAEIMKYLSERRVTMLDGSSFSINNVGVAGVKGFCGGFQNYSLAAWGEDIIKKFVYESVNEALKLENALKYLETEHKIAILHYAPVWETVANEAKEIFPFMGSSRLLDPLDRMQVKHVFHGHAHEGPGYFKTEHGMNIYNVSYPLMKKIQPKQPYHLLTI